MTEPTLILELLAEGGSLTLYRTEKGFIYHTDEGALLDLLDELTPEDVHNSSDFFPSFHEAMMSMLSKYRIFNLYPDQIHPDYLETIKEQYQNFKIIYGFENAYNEANWNRKLDRKRPEEQIVTWQNPSINELEKSYGYHRYTSQRVNFLIDQFLDYRENHSFGEYDESVILSDEELIEREERLEFLTNKMKEVQKEIYPQ